MKVQPSFFAPVMWALIATSALAGCLPQAPATRGNGHTADLFGTEGTTTTVVIDGHGVLRYRGQFAQSGSASAENALKAVLAGDEVAVKRTPHRG